MSTFTLPTGPEIPNETNYVIVSGSRFLYSQSIGTLISPEPYSHFEQNPPTWTTSNNVPIDVALQNPYVYAERVGDSIDVYGKIQIPSNLIDTLSVVAYVTEGTDTIYVVACYYGVENSAEEIRDISFSFPDSPAIKDFSNMEMYLFKGDPKTSRGTVTTVQNHKVYPPK